MSGAAILFVGWINRAVFLDLAYPPGKFATEPNKETRKELDTPAAIREHAITCFRAVTAE